MADVHSKCANCLYFLNAQIMGSCRRYPQTINRHMNDWCGEHAFAITMEEPKPEAPQEPQMVYDITTDTVKQKRKYTRKEKA